MTPECNALLQKSQRSIDSAKLMSEHGFYEFALSRAYYAMFYVAEALLLEQGRSFSSHAAVIAAFGKHLAKPGIVPVKFHRFLIDAQDMRIRGDYEVDTGLTEADALEQIAIAEEILEFAHSMLTPTDT